MKYLKHFEKISSDKLLSASKMLSRLGYNQRAKNLHHWSAISDIKDIGKFNFFIHDKSIQISNNHISANDRKETLLGEKSYYLYDIDIVKDSRNTSTLSTSDYIERFKNHSPLSVFLRFWFVQDIPGDGSYHSPSIDGIDDQFKINLVDVEITILPGDTSDNNPFNLKYIDTYIDDRWEVSDNYPKISLTNGKDNNYTGIFSDRKSALLFRETLSKILKDDKSLPARFSKVSECFWDIFSELGIDSKWYEKFEKFIDKKSINGWFRTSDAYPYFSSRDLE